MCFCVCTLTCTLLSRVAVNMSEWVCCGTDELLYFDGWEGHTGWGSECHTRVMHIYTKVFKLLPHMHARTCTEDISNHSVTPSQIKTNGFIWFSRRLLFGSLLYEAEMYIVSEASVRRAAGGACQSEAHSFSLDWWLAPGSQPPRGDRSNKFITKQQSVY